MGNVSLKVLEKFLNFFEKKVWTLFKYLISSSNFIYSLALKLISRFSISAEGTILELLIW